MGILVCWREVSGFGGLWRGWLWLLGRRCWPLELWFFGFGHPALDVVSLWSCTGGYGGVGPGRGGKRDTARCGAEIVGLLLLLLVRVLWVVLFEADVPGEAADGRHRLELVDDVPWDEVNVVVTELDADIANAFSPQLVELGIIHPLDTLHTQVIVFIYFCILYLQCKHLTVYCIEAALFTWDTGGSYRSSCSLCTTSLKSPASKHTTSLVIRGRLFLWEHKR